MTLRRARRHLLPGAAIAGLGFLLIAPRAWADEVPPAYAGSHMTTPSSTDSSSFSITAEWHRDNNLKLTVETWVTPPSSASECPSSSEVPLGDTPTSQSGSTTYSSVDVSAPCNGTYTFRATAKSKGFLGAGGDSASLSDSIDVAVPPDNVKGVDARVSEAGDSIAVSWSAASSPAPDFLGYRVQRKGADGSYTTIATLSPNDTSYTDTSTPAAGSDVSYRVLGRRSGPHGREVTSTGGGTTTVSVPSPTTTTVPGSTDGGSSTTVPGTTPTTGGTGGAGGGGTAGTTGGKTLTKSGPLNIGNTGIGVPAPSLGTGNPQDFPALGTDGETDPGYNKTLNYGTSDGLASEGSTGDGLSSATYEQGSGRGMAIPVATGFVLAAWAFHLRFLARAARPARVTPRRLRF